MIEDYLLYYGRPVPPILTRTLRAGPVEVLLDGPDLRYIRKGKVEGVRRLYAAVRDHNWLTIPGTITHWEERIDPDSFALHFTIRHHAEAIDLLWNGEITGAADGTITYTFDGIAQSDFRYNRIGFCVLHPGREVSGKPYHGETPDGPIDGILPQEIGPQSFVNGIEAPLFPPVSTLSIEQEPGIHVNFRFEGDLFEMEDQRNWTDASFKTYCTPLALGFPNTIHAGDRIHQVVTVTWQGETDREEAPLQLDTTIDVVLGEALERALPPIGLGLPAEAAPLSAREIARLQALNPAHLRVDLALDTSPGWGFQLRLGAETARQLGCALELAILLGADPASELQHLKESLSVCTGTSIARILLYYWAEECTSGRWVQMAREILAGALPANTPLFGGTNAYFCQINRSRPEIAAMDGVTFSINPQVHAFDEMSLAETLEAQADTITSARLFSGDLPIIVSPVTLRPRFNPNATGPDSNIDPNTLPASVDIRQMSLFAAAWTLGSLKALAESGAASLTYYETVGWRGVLETEMGSPSSFPSEPGIVYPLYHILADLCVKRGAALHQCVSQQALQVQSLALESEGRIHLWIANLTPTRQQIRLITDGWAPSALRRLNSDTGRRLMRDPETYRTEYMANQEGGSKQFPMTLIPFETVYLVLTAMPA